MAANGLKCALTNKICVLSMSRLYRLINSVPVLSVLQPCATGMLSHGTRLYLKLSKIEYRNVVIIKTMVERFKFLLSQVCEHVYLSVHFSEISRNQIYASIPYLRRTPLISFVDGEDDWTVNTHFTRRRCEDDWIVQITSFASLEGYDERSYDDSDDSGTFSSIPYGETTHVTELCPYDVDLILFILEENGDICNTCGHFGHGDGDHGDPPFPNNYDFDSSSEEDAAAAA